MEKWRHSYNIGGNVNWHNHYGKQYGCSLKKNKTLKIDQPYDLAIPSLVYNIIVYNSWGGKESDMTEQLNFHFPWYEKRESESCSVTSDSL